LTAGGGSLKGRHSPVLTEKKTVCSGTVLNPVEEKSKSVREREPVHTDIGPQREGGPSKKGKKRTGQECEG